MKAIPRTNFRSTGSIILIGALALSVAGCASTERARKVTTAGFLNDYSLLKRTKGDVAQLLYINDTVDWAAYDKIILEPVTIWRVPGSQLEDVSQEELNDLGRYFWTAIRDELAKDYTIVQQPGPKTMRFRIALTEAEKSRVAMDMVSSVIPIGIGLSAAKKMATGTHAFVGKATIEAEFKDASTQEVLAAAVATRVGGKTIDSSKLKSWGDVHDAANAWAVRLRDHLAKARAGELVIEEE